jgi:hypothetical protein
MGFHQLNRFADTEITGTANTGDTRAFRACGIGNVDERVDKAFYFIICKVIDAIASAQAIEEAGGGPSDPRIDRNERPRENRSANSEAAAEVDPIWIDVESEE